MCTYVDDASERWAAKISRESFYVGYILVKGYRTWQHILTSSYSDAKATNRETENETDKLSLLELGEMNKGEKISNVGKKQLARQDGMNSGWGMNQDCVVSEVVGLLPHL